MRIWCAIVQVIVCEYPDCAQKNKEVNERVYRLISPGYLTWSGCSRVECVHVTTHPIPMIPSSSLGTGYQYSLKYIVPRLCLKYTCSERVRLYGSGYTLKCIAQMFPIGTRNLHSSQCHSRGVECWLVYQKWVNNTIIHQYYTFNNFSHDFWR